MKFGVPLGAGIAGAIARKKKTKARKPTPRASTPASASRARTPVTGGSSPTQRARKIASRRAPKVPAAVAGNTGRPKRAIKPVMPPKNKIKKPMGGGGFGAL